MKFYLFILKLGLLVPFNASSQKDSVPLINFLNFFVKDYLPIQNVIKINNKVKSNTFSKKLISYTNSFSINLRNDTCIFSASEKKHFFDQLYNKAEEIFFSNYINDSLLVDIELLYHYDSLQANYYKYFGVKYPKYSYLYNQGKISEIPDSILEVRNMYNNLYLDYFKKKVQISTRMVEISKPYFFDNFKKCVVITYKHLNDFRRAELLFFKLSGSRWELKAKVDPLVNIEY